jgi:hypothetical protein
MPSGSSSELRQAAKYRFLDEFEDFLRRVRRRPREYVLCGDWNIAHKEIDLKNWRANQKNSGFLPEERAWMDELFGRWGYRGRLSRRGPAAGPLHLVVEPRPRPGEQRRLAHRLPGRHARAGAANPGADIYTGRAVLRPCAAGPRLRLAHVIESLRRLLEPYRDRRMATLLALGFSSGLPAPLVFTNLSIWLRDEGVSRTDIGLFALAATPYAINFLWAPLVDRMRLPFFSARFGRRRGWALFTQLLLVVAIVVLSRAQPSADLFVVAAAVLFVTFVSATQDVVIDAYRIDVLSPEQYGAGSAAAIWGWHLGGTLIGGAGGLYLAQVFGWNTAYLFLAAGSASACSRSC